MKRLLYELPLHKNPLDIDKRLGAILFDGKGAGEIAPLFPLSTLTLQESLKKGPAYLFATSSLELQLNRARDIPIAPLLFDEDPDERISSTKASTYKIKLSHLTIDDAILKMKRLKNNYPHLIFRLDCNRKWSLEEALHFTSHFSHQDFSYLEEPVRSFEELSIFSKASKFPIAVDESLYEIHLEEILRLPTLRAIVVKPTLFGGLKEIYQLQKKVDPIPIVLSSCFETGVGTIAIAKIAALLDLNEPIGIDTYRFFKSDLLQVPLQYSNSIKKECLTSSIMLDTTFLKELP